jgi:hypothetical protein
VGAIGSEVNTTYAAVLVGQTGYEKDNCSNPYPSGRPGRPIAAAIGLVAPDGGVSLGQRFVRSTCWNRRGRTDQSRYFVYEYYSICKRTIDVKAETSIDTCSSITGCQVRDETVDSIATVTGYYNTANVVPTTCRTFTGAVTSVSECLPWWKKERVYICQSQKQSFAFPEDNLSAVFENAATLAPAMPKMPQASDCIRGCKTKTIAPQTDVIVDGGNATQYRTTTGRTETHYKTCGPTCPLEAGEILVKDCQCLNEFGEAATMMSVLDAAGKELICTSGEKK